MPDEAKRPAASCPPFLPLWFCHTSNLSLLRGVPCRQVQDNLSISFILVDISAILLPIMYNSSEGRWQQTMIVCWKTVLSSPQIPFQDAWGVLIKAFGSTRTDPSRLAIKNLKSAACSLLCLPIRRKAHQTADKTARWKGNILFTVCLTMGG